MTVQEPRGKQGSLYRLDQGGGKKILGNIDISNGLTWNKDLGYLVQKPNHRSCCKHQQLYGNATSLDTDLEKTKLTPENSTNRVMYYIDSLAKTLDAFDYDPETGDISNRRVVFNVDEAGLPGVLDGMTIDSRLGYCVFYSLLCLGVLDKGQG